jgi:hypothetical protein
MWVILCKVLTESAKVCTTHCKAYATHFFLATVKSEVYNKDWHEALKLFSEGLKGRVLKGSSLSPVLKAWRKYVEQNWGSNEFKLLNMIHIEVFYFQRSNYFFILNGGYLIFHRHKNFLGSCAASVCSSLPTFRDDLSFHVKGYISPRELEVFFDCGCLEDETDSKRRWPMPPNVQRTAKTSTALRQKNRLLQK